MFSRLSLNCHAQTDSYLQLMDAALLGPEDVVVCVSQSGSSIDPVMTVKQAKKNGATIIVVTGNAHSPITQYADITLLSVSRETRAEAIASRIAQHTIIDALYVIISLQRMETTLENEKRIWDAWLPKIY
jgi:DNA-binding MurR/RpiR family transcriptional regulator